MTRGLIVRTSEEEEAINKSRSFRTRVELGKPSLRIDLGSSVSPRSDAFASPPHDVSFIDKRGLDLL